MDLTFRTAPKEEDLKAVREIIESTRFFYPHEIEIAVELVQAGLDMGDASGYNFVFAEAGGKTIAYSCFGSDEMSKTCYDLYWIATHNDFRGKGIGKKLLAETEKLAKAMGCIILIAETSGLPHYEPTRAFYINTGFDLEARIKDYYTLGDDKLFFTKRIG
jgi:GNAT superfamily N-acetyltransferase